MSQNIFEALAVIEEAAAQISVTINLPNGRVAKHLDQTGSVIKIEATTGRQSEYRSIKLDIQSVPTPPNYGEPEIFPWALKSTTPDAVNSLDHRLQLPEECGCQTFMKLLSARVQQVIHPGLHCDYDAQEEDTAFRIYTVQRRR